MSETTDIVQFLTAKAAEAWQQGKPYLLSVAGPDMAKASIDYRELLAGERLRIFAERNSGVGRYSVVKHPTQRAKIGIVPYGESYTFEGSEVESPGSATAPAQKKQQGAVLLSFLNSLSELPTQDIDGVVIPARVLVQLAKKK